MPTAEDDDRESNNGVPLYMRTMQLHHCRPGRAGNPETGEPIAILSFLFNKRLEHPVMLSLPEVRRLLAKLVSVLEHHDDHLGKKLAMLFFPNGEWPTNPADERACKTRPAPTHLAKPSLRPTMPSKPIGNTDVWQMMRMLSNVSDHETFLRLIGVQEADIPVVRAHSSSAKSKHGHTVQPSQKGRAASSTPKRKRRS